MPLPDSDTDGGPSFGLEVDGLLSSPLTEVTGLRMEREVVEIKEQGPDGTVAVRRLPGRWKSPEITLTRGLTADASFGSWVKEAHQESADTVSRKGAVTVLDPTGALMHTYLFAKAWPKSLEILRTLGPDGTTTLSEQLVLVCERIEPG